MRLLKLPFIMQILVLASLLFSCSDDKDGDQKDVLFPENIEGCWSFSSSTSTSYYIFDKEGVGLMYRLIEEYDGEGAITPFQYAYDNELGTITVDANGTRLFKIDINSYQTNEFTASLNNVKYTIKKQTSPSEKSIIGTWEVGADTDEVISYEFKNDGVLIETVIYKGEVESVNEKKYKLDKNMILTIDYIEDEEQFTDINIILGISDNSLTLQTDEGQEIWLKK